MKSTLTLLFLLSAAAVVRCKPLATPSAPEIVQTTLPVFGDTGAFVDTDDINNSEEPNVNFIVAPVEKLIPLANDYNVAPTPTPTDKSIIITTPINTAAIVTTIPIVYTRQRFPLSSTITYDQGADLVVLLSSSRYDGWNATIAGIPLQGEPNSDTEPVIDVVTMRGLPDVSPFVVAIQVQDNPSVLHSGNLDDSPEAQQDNGLLVVVLWQNKVVSVSGDGQWLATRVWPESLPVQVNNGRVYTWDRSVAFDTTDGGWARPVVTVDGKENATNAPSEAYLLDGGYGGDASNLIERLLTKNGTRPYWMWEKQAILDSANNALNEDDLNGGDAWFRLIVRPSGKPLPAISQCPSPFAEFNVSSIELNGANVTYFITLPGTAFETEKSCERLGARLAHLTTESQYFWLIGPDTCLSRTTWYGAWRTALVNPLEGNKCLALTPGIQEGPTTWRDCDQILPGLCQIA